LKKIQKYTQIYFNEAESRMEISTHNTDLKRRMTAYAKEYPELCRITEDAGDGCMSFEIDKHRCGIRLTAPYSEERKDTASKLAKANGIHTRPRKEGAHE